MTSDSGATLLGEVLEHQASGQIAVIYDEVRRFSGVPYVSSLQRYLATMPGVLEWAWGAVRPAMVSGAIPKAGWRLARSVRISPLPRVSPPVLRVWGVDHAGLAAIRNIAENFVRVSPVNLMTGACLRLLLTGTRQGGSGFHNAWQPPRMLAPMPGNVDLATLPPEERAVLMQFGTEMDGKPFVPALYRQLAHWPAFLGWLATELGPRFGTAETARAGADFRDAAWKEAPAIVARLPGPQAIPLTSAEFVPRILNAIEGYAKTSPEMVMFGQLILDALLGAG
jgi:hypothetical protein